MYKIQTIRSFTLGMIVFLSAISVYPENESKNTTYLPDNVYINDAYDDLAIGVYLEDWGGAADMGIAHVMKGAAGDYIPGSGETWDPINDLGEPPEADSHFGYALATGDISGDGIPDLAIGAPAGGF